MLFPKKQNHFWIKSMVCFVITTRILLIILQVTNLLLEKEMDIVQRSAFNYNTA